MTKAFLTGFTAEINTLKQELYANNYELNQDTKLLGQHLKQLTIIIEKRNREVERKMTNMKKMIYQYATYK